MNHTVKRIPGEAAPGAAVKPLRALEPYIVVGAMFAYAWLGALAVGSGSFAIGVTISTVAYFLAIYLYYGIARLAFGGRNYLLWIGAVLGFVLGYMLSGMDGLWSLLTGYTMIVCGGVVVGRLSRSGYNQHRIYLIGLLVVAAFAIAQSAPWWQQMMTTMSDMTDNLLTQMEQNLTEMGYGADAVRKSLDGTDKMFRALARLVPGMTVLGAVLPFSVGFIVFNLRLDPKVYSGRTLAPFVLWKMPFASIPVVIAVILMRILGSESIELAADNLIAVLTLFYSVTGLALMEFYLRKLKFSTALKLLFYIIFFLTQLIGFLVAALLGFIDSFVDWRKVQQLSLAKE